MGSATLEARTSGRTALALLRCCVETMPVPPLGVLATDRPISFWEATHQPRTIDYPFTVIQMELDREGHGKGTLSPRLL